MRSPVLKQETKTRRSQELSHHTELVNSEVLGIAKISFNLLHKSTTFKLMYQDTLYIKLKYKITQKILWNKMTNVLLLK